MTNTVTKWDMPVHQKAFRHTSGAELRAKIMARTPSVRTRRIRYLSSGAAAKQTRLFRDCEIREPERGLVLAPGGRCEP
jgi:hypothetical protein